MPPEYRQGPTEPARPGRRRRARLTRPRCRPYPARACPGWRPHPPSARARGPPLPRPPPPARAAPLAAGRPGRRAGGLRAARLGPVRPAGGGGPQPRPRRSTPACATTTRPGRTSSSTSGASSSRLYNKMLSLLPTAELPWYRLAWDRAANEPDVAASCTHGATRSSTCSSGSASDGPAVQPRLRAARGGRLVLGTDQRDPRRPRGALGGRRPRAGAARRQPPLLRPDRAAVPGRAAGPPAATSASSTATGCCPATAPTACSARAARRSCGTGTGRARRRPTDPPERSSGRSSCEELMGAGELVPVAVEGVRGTRYVLGDEVELLAAAAPPDPPGGHVPRAARSARLGPRPAAPALRLRLHLGGLRPAGQAALGLLRAADPVRGPARGPDRATDRPRRGRRAHPGPVVGGRVRARGAPTDSCRRCGWRSAAYLRFANARSIDWAPHLGAARRLIGVRPSG